MRQEVCFIDDISKRGLKQKDDRTGRTLEETAAIFDGDEQQLELASTGGRAVRMATLSYHGTIAVYTSKDGNDDEAKDSDKT